MPSCGAEPTERPDEIRNALRKSDEERNDDERRLIQERDLAAMHVELTELEDRQLFATQRPYPERSPFLLAFGQPERKSPCACERAAEPTLDQSLRMLNGKEVHDLLQRSMEHFADLDANVFLEELYLTAYARLPGKRERDIANAYLQAPAPTLGRGFRRSLRRVRRLRQSTARRGSASHLRVPGRRPGSAGTPRSPSATRWRASPGSPTDPGSQPSAGETPPLGLQLN